MAFILRDFQPVGGSARSGSPSLDGAGVVINPPGNNAKTVWVYGSNDSVTTVVTAGYFNEVRDLVNPQDAILLAVAGGTKDLRWTSFLVVPKSPLKTDVTISGLNQDAA